MAVLASRPDGCAWRLAGRLVSVKPAIELQSICPPSLETSASVMGKSKGRKKKTRTDGSAPGVPREDRRDAGHEQASPDGEPPTLQPGDDSSYPDSRQSPSSRTPRDNSRRKTALDVRLQPEDQSNLEGRMAEAAESGDCARPATHQPSEQELGKNQVMTWASRLKLKGDVKGGYCTIDGRQKQNWAKGRLAWMADLELQVERHSGKYQMFVRGTLLDPEAHPSLELPGILHKHDDLSNVALSMRRFRPCSGSGPVPSCININEASAAIAAAYSRDAELKVRAGAICLMRAISPMDAVVHQWIWRR